MKLSRDCLRILVREVLLVRAELEKSYDKYLRGEDGAFMEEVDVAGNVVKHYDSVQPVPGKNLKLTIDYELQKELETFYR